MSAHSLVEEDTTATYQATEIRRHQIALAARKLIVTRGIANLTIQELAAEVDLSEGALYRHFETKDDILLLVIDDIAATLLQLVDEVVAGPGSALERLEELLRRHISYAERRRGVSFIVIGEAMQLGGMRLRKRVNELLHTYLQRVADLVREAVASGEADPVDPEAAALVLFGIVQANVTMWSLNRGRHSLAETGASMWLTYRDGLRGRREASASPVDAGESR